jgi:hypothetical protein
MRCKICFNSNGFIDYEVKEFEKRAKELNAKGLGDQSSFYLQKKGTLNNQ